MNDDKENNPPLVLSSSLLIILKQLYDICVETNYAWYHLSCSISQSHLSFYVFSASHTHFLSEIGCLLPPQSFGRGRTEGIRTWRGRKKKATSHKQRPAYRVSGAHSGGEKNLPGMQVNQGHAVIIGGPCVETDLYSAWTQMPPLALHLQH